MKPLFQKQCEALVKTLTKAKENDNAALKMQTWVHKNHTCGTAACVCGYQALSDNLSLFKGAAVTDGYADYDELSSNIARDLDNSCCELFSHDYLAQSIYGGIAYKRFTYASCAKIADEEKLETFNHLTSDEPTLDDAIEYIQFVIEKCKEKAA